MKQPQKIVIITSALVDLFLAELRKKNYSTEKIFTAFGENVAHGLRNKPLHFRRITLRIRLELG